jgi:hypothetical protein
MIKPIFVKKMVDNIAHICAQSTGDIHNTARSIELCVDALLSEKSTKPEYFVTQEFIPEKIYTEFKDYAVQIFMDNRLVFTCDMLREYFNCPVVINNWHTGGTCSESGFRLQNTQTGKEYSQHKFGRAADLKFTNISAEEVRKEILSHSSEPAFRFISAIESGVPWLHVDVRNSCENGIILF